MIINHSVKKNILIKMEIASILGVLLWNNRYNTLNEIKGLLMWNRTPNYKCVICDKEMYVRPNQLLKNSGWGFTCSKECGIINRSKHTKGKSNHQFGLIGEKNSSFKTGRRISNYGYVLIYKPEHNRKNCNGYVFEHILIMESKIGRSLKYYGDKNKNNEVCHHIDRNRQNNDINNLQLMTMSEHLKIHMEEDRERSLKAGKTNSILNEKQVEEIRELLLKNISQKEIGKKYDCSQSVISAIKLKQRYCYGKKV